MMAQCHHNILLGSVLWNALKIEKAHLLRLKIGGQLILSPNRIFYTTFCFIAYSIINEEPESL